MKQLMAKKSINLLLFVILVGQVNSVKPASDAAKLGLGFAALSGLTALGLNLYWNSDTYYRKVINNSNNALRQAINFNEHFNILAKGLEENGFIIRKISMSADDIRSRRTTAVSKFFEKDIFEKLNPAINQVNVNFYLGRLTDAINSLKSNIKPLRRTVRKVNSFQTLKSEYTESDHLLTTMEQLLYDLEFLRSYVETHRGYFDLLNSVRRINVDYVAVFEVSDASTTATIADELKRYARRTFATNYPFSKFVEIVEKDMTDLNGRIRNLNPRYPLLLQNAERALARLSRLREVVKGDNDYFLEAQRQQQDRKEEEKNRREQELLDLERRKVQAREREVEARERAARAQELAILSQNTRPQQPPIIVNVAVTVGSGVSFAELINKCLDNNLIGLEEFSGIPGTVGGSVYINIHYFEFLLNQFLINATVIEKSTGKILNVENSWFNFGYNNSTLLQKDFFLVDATFKLKKVDSLATSYAKGRCTEIIRHRLKRYPNKGTCGSFFRNFYENEVTLQSGGKKIIFVAYYLDKIGVKGNLSVGDAIVSYQHANMIFNQGNATSTDIINVAKQMQTLVQQNFGILPQPECQLVGFKQYPLMLV